MKKDLISVIMSVYKENKIELEDSINSILNQTYKNFEFIIVIDNPKEKWRIDFINSIKDNRIKLIINEENIGLPRSLNKALLIANGNFIARMDADDISEKTRLDVQLKYLKDNNLDICGSFVTCFFRDKNVKKNTFPITPKGIHRMIYYKNCIAHPTFFVKKEVYDALGGYRDIYSCEDYEFLLRVDKKGYKIGNVPQFLFNYRLTENSISRLNPGKQILVSNFIKNWYKRNDENIELSKIEKYLKSNYYEKSISKYNNYWKIRNIRSSQRNNFFKYIYYSLLSLKYIKITLNEINCKIIEIFIKRKESRK